jgi:hypothetical protein
MKPRRVFITLEVKTDAPLEALAGGFLTVSPRGSLDAAVDEASERFEGKVLQRQVNVAKHVKELATAAKGRRAR